MPAAPTAHGDTDTDGARQHGRVRRTLLIALVAAAALCAVLASAGGTYAFWSAEETAGMGTLTTGTASLEADWGEKVDATALVPGKSVLRTAVLRNSGDAPLALSVVSAGPTSGLELGAAGGTCAEAGSTAVLGTSPVALTAPGSGGAALVVPPAGEATLCLRLTATPDLVPGQQVSYTLRIDGTQTR